MAYVAQTVFPMARLVLDLHSVIVALNGVIVEALMHVVGQDDSLLLAIVLAYRFR